jgi:hypothetical protein
VHDEPPAAPPPAREELPHRALRFVGSEAVKVEPLCDRAIEQQM